MQGAAFFHQIEAVDAFDFAVGEEFSKHSQGSGVVVTSDGYILTAAHVIGGPDQVATIRDMTEPLAAQLGDSLPLDTERGYNVMADGYRPKFDVSVASLDQRSSASIPGQ